MGRNAITENVLEVEENVPIPLSIIAGLAYGLDWSKLKVGDSVFMPGYVMGRPEKGFVSLNPSAIRSKYPDMTWACRSAVKDGIKGIRIWRVK